MDDDSREWRQRVRGGILISKFIDEKTRVDESSRNFGILKMKISSLINFVVFTKAQRFMNGKQIEL